MTFRTIFCQGILVVPDFAGTKLSPGVVHTVDSGVTGDADRSGLAGFTGVLAGGT